MLPLGTLRAQTDSTLLVGRPTQIAFTLGTTGVGLEVARLATNRIGVRVGAAGGGFTLTNYSASDLTVDASLRLVTVRAVLDAYPFSRASFHLTGGVLAGTSVGRATAKPANDTYNVNGTNYAASHVGHVNGSVTLPNVMPYVGIGFGRPRAFGFRFVPLADLGVGFGKATTTLRAENGPNDPQLARDIEAERVKVQQKLDKYPVFPVLSASIGWRF